jgi:hypothetical protein
MEMAASNLLSNLMLEKFVYRLLRTNCWRARKTSFSIQIQTSLYGNVSVRRADSVKTFSDRNNKNKDPDLRPSYFRGMFRSVLPRARFGESLPGNDCLQLRRQRG